MARPPDGGGYAALTPSRLNLFLWAALSAVGQPYKWGGTGLNSGVDCSGLIYQALRFAGYAAPRTAGMQANWTTRVPNEQMKPGDLIFWDLTGRKTTDNGIDHAAIYLGNNMVVEASSGQKSVVIRKLWGNYRVGRITRGITQPNTSIPLGSSNLNPGNWVDYVRGKPPTPPPPGGKEGSTDPLAAALAMLGLDGGVTTAAPDLPPGPPRLAKNASMAEIEEFIRENYGVLGASMLKIPELREAMIKAAQDGMVGDRFMVEVENTKWWRSRTEAMRKFDILESYDPTEAARQVQEKKAELAGTWESYGVNADIDEMARQAIRLGLGEVELNQRIAKSLQTESSQKGLDAGSQGAASTDELMRIARMEYLTPIDRLTAERWVIKALRTGQDVEEEFRSYLARLSSSRFGIDPTSGIAPSDVMAPVRMAVAESLEINPEEIDFLDPKYRALMQVETSDGRFRPMTAYEATQWARSQEQFRTTRTANDEAAAVAEGLAKSFGLVG